MRGETGETGEPDIGVQVGDVCDETKGIIQNKSESQTLSGLVPVWNSEL